ncbi:MAG: tail fiber protein, partial [Henriciella sp.]|uniref:phage tail protein n=1 Tax=Henriciella sp. TaxID=1968823 RepID=UPI003C73D308
VGGDRSPRQHNQNWVRTIVMKIQIMGAALAAMCTGTVFAPAASAGPDPYIGEVAIYPYNFCPRSWMPAHGQLLPISQYSALFSLYGTTYGGDGRTTFALPDLRGRVIVGTGQGPGLSDRRWGETFGSETATLSVENLPAHSHEATARASKGAPDTPSPAGGSVADFGTDGTDAYGSASPETAMAPGTVVVSETGGGVPVNIMPPSAAIQYCVAIQGLYPSRN